MECGGKRSDAALHNFVSGVHLAYANPPWISDSSDASGYLE
jgi:hypothetical protein